MNRRDFLRSAVAGAVIAALPAAVVAEVTAPSPIMTGEIGRYYNLRFISGYRVGKSLTTTPALKAALGPAIKFKHPVALKNGDTIDCYYYYADPEDDLLAQVKALPNWKLG